MDNINVLIIEDTPEQSDALTKVLLENNYTVAGVAKNFTDAIKLFYENTVDVIIIDVFLDGKPDGITFAETINIIPNSSKPFVFLTSSQLPSTSIPFLHLYLGNEYDEVQTNSCQLPISGPPS